MPEAVHEKGTNTEASVKQNGNCVASTRNANIYKVGEQLDTELTNGDSFNQKLNNSVLLNIHNRQTVSLWKPKLNNYL